MKAFTVFTSLLSTALAVVFPQPQGPYKATWESLELVDQSRVDPFNSSHTRRMMISRFSPVSPSHCTRTCWVPYMPPAIAKIEDDIVVAFLGDVGWPVGLYGKLEMEVCCEVAGRPEKKFPTILFDTGLNTTRLSYSVIAQELASEGYEVIVMDHPYETDVVQFPDGEIIFGGRVARDPNDTVGLQFGMDVRAKDASFILDTYKVCQTVYIGQSFGGAAAANAMVYDKRIVGGVNLDGMMFGHPIEQGVSRPFLVFGSDGHNSTSDPSFAAFFNAMKAHHPRVWAKELSMKDTVHGSYLDQSVMADVAGLRDNPELLPFFGEASGKRVMQVMRAYLSDFIEFTLHHKEEGVLAGPVKAFPEVSFLRTWKD